VLAASLTLGALAFAPDEAVAGEDPAFRSRVDVGVGSAAEDAFFLLLLEQGFQYRGLDVLLAGPLRLRIHDEPPRENAVIREQDWDEPSDYARIAPRIRYEGEFNNGALLLHLGELNGVGIGHGAVMDHYYNNTDMDHYKGGAYGEGHFAGNGAQLALDNVISPRAFAARAFAAPIAWFLEGDWPRRLEFGYTIAADTGIPAPSDAAPDDSVVITGGDISLVIVDVSFCDITPYFDMLVMDGEPGIHAGLATSWVLSEERNVDLHLRGEYRRLGRDYHPVVFNPFHEHNRRHFIGRDAATGLDHSLTEHLAQVDDPVRNGFMADLTLDWDERVRFQARYDNQGRDMPHWLLLRADITPSDRFSLGILYAGQDMRGGTGVFSQDSLMAISADAGIWGPLRIFAEFTRRWRRTAGTMAYANESAGGLGLLFAY